jgi:hypothetical protein
MTSTSMSTPRPGVSSTGYQTPSSLGWTGKISSAPRPGRGCRARGTRRRPAWAARGRFRRSRAVKPSQVSATVFQPGPVGHGGAQLHAGGGADWSQRVVRHQVDVVGLAPAGHLHGFGKSANVANVDASKVCEALFDVRRELPLAGELLADGEGHVGHGAQGGVGVGAFVADRLFQEVNGPRRHALAEGSRFSHAQPVVVVGPNHGSRPHGRAQGGVPLGGDGDRLTRLEDSVAVRPEAPDQGSDALPALRHVALNLLDQVVQVLRAGGHEAGHEVALLAAQQLVDGHIKALGHQVVQGDVNGRHRGGQHAPALEVLAAVGLLPDAADAARVLPDQEVTEVGHRPAHRQVAGAQAGLAPAVVPVVGLDPYDLHVAEARVEGVELDVGDFHDGA